MAFFSSVNSSSGRSERPSPNQQRRNTYGLKQRYSSSFKSRTSQASLDSDHHHHHHHHHHHSQYHQRNQDSTIVEEDRRGSIKSNEEVFGSQHMASNCGWRSFLCRIWSMFSSHQGKRYMPDSGTLFTFIEYNLQFSKHFLSLPLILLNITIVLCFFLFSPSLRFYDTKPPISY